MKEIWKNVINYEELYEISNLGRIRSKDRIVFQKNNGTICKHIYKGKMMKVNKNPKGYFQVRLSKNGKATTKTIHRLVAEAFIFHKDNDNIVNHLDNNPSNSIVSNLEWTTYKGNMQWASKQGRMKFNPDNLKKAQESRKKTVIATDKDGKEYEFSSQKEASEILKCNRRHISQICKNKYGYKTTKGYSFRYKEEI